MHIVTYEPQDGDKPYVFDAERPDDWFPQIGEFYWVRAGEQPSDYSIDNYAYFKDDEDEEYWWFGCVMEIGSNYVLLWSPKFDSGYSTQRIHFDDLENMLHPVDDSAAFIQSQIGHYQHQVKMLLDEVQEVTKQLGVVPHTEITDNTGRGDNALAVLHGKVDTNAYKTALVKAKDEDLPALFKKIEHANKRLAGWMCAPTLPTQAQIGPMKKDIKQIEDRIYTIELYAGLTEEAVKVRDGDPARTIEPLRVMQRRLYMDEECLLDYDAGGIDINSVTVFDEWLSRPHNADRLLPFPRCMVAFRVRRYDKEREDGGNMMSCFINSQIREADKTTYLYVRNGDQIWRVDCDFVFDEMIIPNADMFDPSGEMMVKDPNSSRCEFMPKSRYDALLPTWEKYDAWRKKFDGKPNPAKGPRHSYWSGDNPYYEEIGWFSPSAWRPFNDSDVYFDEASESLAAEIKRYNRVAVIIQGLFDRSLVLHPHPPVQVWNPESFARSVELIYDALTLTHGDKPDFEAYRAKLNASMGPDSIVTGQEEVWMRLEAARENERQANSYRDSHRKSNYVRLRPHGNPGPGLVAKMSEWKPRARKAAFRWEMEMEDWRRWSSGTKPKVVTVSADDMLNVSAYTPGDYKQFFQDPRTRREYLKWAPLLLAAEDYHAGKLALGKAGSKGNDWD